MLRILIVDDHELLRKNIRRLLSTRLDFLICGEAEDGIQAVDKAKTLRPDIILMDVSMPRMDGVQAARIVCREVPESKVVIVSQNDRAIVARQTNEVRAAAFVAKSDLAEQLIPTLDGLTDI